MKATAFAVFLIAATISAQQSEEVIERVESPAPWSKVPSDFRGAPFDGSIDQLRSAIGELKCSDVSASSSNSYYAPVDHVRCEPKNRMAIGGTPMNESYFFLGGKLAAIRVGPPRLSLQQVLAHVPTATPFDPVRAAFIDRYGEPTLKVRTRIKGNREETIYSGLGRRIQIVPWEAITDTLTWRAPDILSVTLKSDVHGGFDEAWFAKPSWTAAVEAGKKAQSKTTPF